MGFSVTFRGSIRPTISGSSLGSGGYHLPMLLRGRKTPATSTCNPCPVLPPSIPKASMQKSFDTLPTMLEQCRDVPALSPVPSGSQMGRPDGTGAPWWGHRLPSEPSVLRPAQLRQHKRLPKLLQHQPANSSILTGSRRAAKHGALLQGGRVHTPSPHPSWGLAERAAVTGGSRHAANRWDFQRNHCEGARQHQTPAACPGSWVSTMASWRESYKLCLRFMLVL